MKPRHPQEPRAVHARSSRSSRSRSVVGGYILDNQRLRFPLVEDKPMRIYVELDTAQAVTPGPGPDRAGRRRADRRHRRGRSSRTGRALVGAGHREASTATSSAATPPRCCARARGLKDMYVQVFPGKQGAPVKEGFTIPIAQLADRRRPRRDPLRARRAHARLPHAAGQRRRRGPEGQRQRPRRGARALRPDRRATSRRVNRGGRPRSASRCGASSPRFAGQRRARRAPAGPLAPRLRGASGTLRAFAAEDDNLRDARRRARRRRCSGDGDARRRHAVRPASSGRRRAR